MGENPAPVAQLDRARRCGRRGRRFESFRERHWRVRIVVNCASFENSREQSLHRFESCTLRLALPDTVWYLALLGASAFSFVLGAKRLKGPRSLTG